MQLAGSLGQLTYCTNIHRGETWPEVAEALKRHVPEIRRALAPEGPFGIGLRLGAAATEALKDPTHLGELKSLLAAEDSYVFTINGFPYGDFHGRRVKENVYAPDWSTPERLGYTNALADILAELLPSGMDGSISTVPGTFAPRAEGRLDTITDNFVRHAVYLHQIRERSGRTIALALEPEPRCFLETIEETAAYFESGLYGDKAIAQMAELTGLTRGDAADALRRHLGVCYDVCHAAVEFEDARASIDLLRGTGVAIPKLQLSAALRIDRVSEQTAAALAPFDEPVYLHQVVARTGNGLKRYLDLPDALADLKDTLGSEWRVHFHVPIFLDAMEHFSTTQDFLRDILALHSERPISGHLEVETYTWDVLPERYRGTPVGTAIARELNWVRQQLAA